jgi:hypothetical protein
MPFPAPPNSFPTKDEMGDFLERYAAHFQLPVRSGVRVNRAWREGTRYFVDAGALQFETEHVVVAMASYQGSRVPSFAKELAPEIVQMHSINYKSLSQLKPGGVLIVGAANSGAEIAVETATAHPTWIAGRDVGAVPFSISKPWVQRIVLPILFRLVFHRILTVDTPMGRKARPKFMGDIEKFAEATVQELDAKLKDVRIPRANLGPCPVCGNDIVENRKGYSCWSREDPGCGFVIWKNKAGKTLTATIVKELIESLRESIARGDQPPVGRTKGQVTGFRGRSGRSFRAKLKLEQNEEGKWRVDFDEDWAQGPRGAPPAEDEAQQQAEPEKVAAGVADESA